jgi:hypothetical protein
MSECDCWAYTPPTPEEIATAKEAERLAAEERESMRWCPARSATEQVAKQLNALARYVGPVWAGVGRRLEVFGRVVGVDVSAEEALAMLDGRRARA